MLRKGKLGVCNLTFAASMRPKSSRGHADEEIFGAVYSALEQVRARIFPYRVSGLIL